MDQTVFISFSIFNLLKVNRFGLGTQTKQETKKQFQFSQFFYNLTFAKHPENNISCRSRPGRIVAFVVVFVSCVIQSMKSSRGRVGEHHSATIKVSVKIQKNSLRGKAKILYLGEFKNKNKLTDLCYNCSKVSNGKRKKLKINPPLSPPYSISQI